MKCDRWRRSIKINGMRIGDSIKTTEVYKEITAGLELCLKKLLGVVAPENILLNLTEEGHCALCEAVLKSMDSMDI